MSVLETARTLYSCNEPVKKKAYYFFFLGNSMVSGYSSDYTELTAADQNKYMPVAPITQYKKHANTDVANMFVNIDRTYFSTFGNFAAAMIDMYDTGAFSDGELFLIQISYNGSLVINGEASNTWSKDDVDGYLYSSLTEADIGILYLQKCGYDVIISGVNFSLGSGSNSCSDQDIFLTEYRGVISEIREHYNDLNIPFVLGAVPVPGGFDPEGELSNAAFEIIKATDSLVDIFYIGNYPTQANDTIHQRSQGVLAFGQFVGSAFAKFKSGLQYPIASNVLVTGTLKSGQSVSASWNYNSPNGALEGASRISLTYADNTSGLNEIWLNQHFQGQSKQLSSTHIGKYIRARVEPVALTGPKTGHAVLSPWAGPVVA